MILQGSSVKGRKIIAKQAGKEINDVDDVLYNPQNGVVDALVISSPGMFSTTAQILKIRDIISFGADAFMIDSDSVVRDVSGDSIKKFRVKDILLGKKLLSEDGTLFGTISDYFFDTESGKLTKLQLSKGLLEDIQGNKQDVTPSDGLRLGDDAVILLSHREAPTTHEDMPDETESTRADVPSPTIKMNDMAHYAMPVNSTSQPTAQPQFSHRNDSAIVRKDLDEMTQQANDAAERIKHEAQIMKDFVSGTAEEIKGRLGD